LLSVKISYICTRLAGWKEGFDPSFLLLYIVITKERIQQLVEEKIADTDIFIVEIKVSESNAIKIEIDADAGLSIDKCIAVSRHVEHSFDREEEDFELSVTSPGIDKPLRLPRQFKKNIGRSLKVKYQDDKAALTGELIDANDDSFTILEKRKERLEGKKKKVAVEEKHEFAYNQIKEAKVVISFK
tara:strand:+ start:15586 stop:16143 length:558 start_codon:yes stop_codon:yes gene_type:complete